jgi:DNA topoisomerase-1
MKKNIIVVESPAKVKTIENFLGSDYKVVATYGHIRDLPKSKLGIDVKKDFLPQYIIPTKSRKTISQLKDAFKNATKIYLATDYDREGEAIAWHVLKACDLPQDTTQRITFHEITKSALEDAIKNPRHLDTDLVDAQQARRVLDRLVGYTLSPFLWKKVTKGLSAGRVQSVAVRLIVDREREIEAFKAQEYWSIEATFDIHSSSVEASLVAYNNKPIDKMGISTKDQSQDLIKELKTDNYIVDSLESKKERRSPYAPYTTSTLQQDANKRLRLSSKATMRLAQDLYEAGLITYMRTDSTQVASIAANAASDFIKSKFGQEYLPASKRIYKSKSKNAQEAHEAIRPTKPEKMPQELESKWSPRHLSLYELIWQRFIASQMAEASLEKVSCTIVGIKNKGTFKLQGQKIAFDGFLKVYPIKIEEKTLPNFAVKDEAKLKDIIGNQHFTLPPARFNEASLVKALEELGVGRPSTYAPTISTIVDRGYVRIEQRVFYPQEIGLIVIDLLKEHFPNIVNPGFTASMEKDLDEVAEGHEKWTKVLGKFWQDYEPLLEQKTQNVDRQLVAKEIGEDCPQCGKPLIERFGKYGKFIACSGFPECKYIRSIVVETGFKCPECKVGNLIERRTRKGNRLFWGCNQYPKCKYATWNNPAKQETPTKEGDNANIT